MAAIALTGPYPNIHRVSLADATKWYEFTMDKGAGKVSIYPATNACNLGARNTAGAELSDGDTFVSGTDHYVPITADVLTELQMRGALGRVGRNKIFVNPSVNATVVSIIVEAV